METSVREIARGTIRDPVYRLMFLPILLCLVINNILVFNFLMLVLTDISSTLLHIEPASDMGNSFIQTIVNILRNYSRGGSVSQSKLGQDSS
jgi:hypothetical protein